MSQRLVCGLMEGGLNRQMEGERYSEESVNCTLEKFQDFLSFQATKTSDSLARLADSQGLHRPGGNESSTCVYVFWCGVGGCSIPQNLCSRLMAS